MNAYELQQENDILRQEIHKLQDKLRDSNAWKAQYLFRLETLKAKLKELSDA